MARAKEQHTAQVVELCRRTTHRMFFWRPGRDTRELMGYMYGKAHNDKLQQAHVASCLSTHLHLLQSDLARLRSSFMQQFFSNSARKRNLQLNRREHLWAAGGPGDMVVLDLEKVIERVLYVVLQPVAAGLVERVEDWTGFQILPRDWGKPMRFERPAQCGPKMPEFVEFTPMPPPGFEHLPLQDVIDFFEYLIAEKEREYARARARKRRRVVGIRACEATNPFSSPATPAPMRTLNPRFTSSDKTLVVGALRRTREFQRQHRQAYNAFRRGNRDAVFPAGTLQMAQRAGVKCAECAEDHPMSYRRKWTAKVQSSWDTWLENRTT